MERIKRVSRYTRLEGTRKKCCEIEATKKKEGEGFVPSEI
jgi:hypothetical protein